MKVLVLASEPVDAQLVQAALGDEAQGAEVLVVSPALNESPVAFWVSDSDEAIAEAQAVVDESVERLEEGGVSAAGDTGEGEPVQAVRDALATFPADHLLVFTHPGGESAYREEDLAGLDDLGVPVTRSTVSR
jgi:hypothetical protein